MNIVLFSNDLFFASQLAAAAHTTGFALHQVAEPGKIEDGLQLCGDAVVLLDLSAPELHRDFALVAKLRAAATPPRAICAFGQHVLEARLQQARAAGCEHVLSRGQLSRNAASFLASFQT